ncbi:hypothetical protein [Halarcobacter sp.]|uniref:hypothetical protein n=1 Tax=Halarcobacter sp. TaxID=2321133 RepID=UPI0029F46DE5|nr:hypothetical protein [Halarcobacter sp.]
MYSIGLDVSKSTINVYIPINDLDLISGLKYTSHELLKYLLSITPIQIKWY